MAFRIVDNRTGIWPVRFDSLDEAVEAANDFYRKIVNDVSEKLSKFYYCSYNDGDVVEFTCTLPRNGRFAIDIHGDIIPIVEIPRIIRIVRYDCVDPKMVEALRRDLSLEVHIDERFRLVRGYVLDITISLDDDEGYDHELVECVIVGVLEERRQ